VLESYFEPDHLAAQDVLADLADRTVVADEDDGAVRRTTWRVTAKKPVPLFARPFVPGGKLQYLESMTLRRADSQIDLAVVPQILKGRVHLDAVYDLADVGPGQVRRRYKGSITAAIPLLSGRIEKGVLAEIRAQMPVMSDCTQRWLAARYP
jgi:hypothetical protein